MNMSYLISLQETIIRNSPPLLSAKTIAAAMHLAREFMICDTAGQDPYPGALEILDTSLPHEGPSAVLDADRALLALLVIEFDRNWTGVRK